MNSHICGKLACQKWTNTAGNTESLFVTTSELQRNYDYKGRQHPEYIELPSCLET